MKLNILQYNCNVNVMGGKIEFSADITPVT